MWVGHLYVVLLLVGVSSSTVQQQVCSNKAHTHTQTHTHAPAPAVARVGWPLVCCLAPGRREQQHGTAAGLLE